MVVKIKRNLVAFDKFSTSIFGGKSSNSIAGVNLIVVSNDESKSDTYGRQTEHFTSIPHQKSQPAPGNYWKHVGA